MKTAAASIQSSALSNLRTRAWFLLAVPGKGKPGTAVLMTRGF